MYALLFVAFIYGVPALILLALTGWAASRAPKECYYEEIIIAPGTEDERTIQAIYEKISSKPDPSAMTPYNFNKTLDRVAFLLLAALALLVFFLA